MVHDFLCSFLPVKQTPLETSSVYTTPEAQRDTSEKGSAEFCDACSPKIEANVIHHGINQSLGVMVTK
jgi:hypothetical protein